MKSLATLFALIAPGILFAQQEPGAKPSPQQPASYAPSAFAVSPPDEGSPFFAERRAAKFALSKEGQSLLEAETVATFPKSKDSPDSVTSIFTKFFTDMFASVRLGRLRPERTTESLVVEPGEFSLAERRELDATYTVRNNAKKLIRLDFNTSQRIDMLTSDASGKVVEKWSEDRGFFLQEGVVIINPRERIEYSEKVATREMKPSETYTIKADVVGYPDYSAETGVTPSP
ncbi:MAG TPA: BsuPI-related putative proteinase inhibitor [Terrimicrobiaceae bacterium]